MYYIEENAFATIKNGGFEDDKDIVEPEGGIYNNLPTGWDSHRSTIMIDYSVRSDYYQANSGSIFLSILASRGGYIEQTIYACKGLNMTLSFTAASFNCQECQHANFNITVNSESILIHENVPTTWTKYEVNFIAPSNSFSLRFQPEYKSNVQLFLDNTELSGNSH